MSNNPEFAGVYPAMTTPFTEDHRIDFDYLTADAQRLEAAGVDGLVPVGSTGESATLTHDEHIEVIQTVIDAVSDIPVIAGAGSNSTEEAVQLSQRSEAIGADAVLHISPYYNKPEPAGMEAHYQAIADNVDIPVILYNVPSRTGRNIEIETASSLARHPNITAYKAASGDVGRVAEVVERTRQEDFTVLSGDDGLTLPLLSVGATGVISVAANLEPERVSELVWSALDGDFERALACHHDLASLFRVLFIETNPIPVKEAMAIKYDAPPYVRMPLTRLHTDHRDRLAQELRNLEQETTAT